MTTFIAVVGGAWSLVDILSSWHFVNKEKLPFWFLICLFLSGLLVVIFTRRPVKKIKYKYPGQDLTIEVCIDDLFTVNGQKVISTNTTFDTDIASGIISEKSLQGQFTNKYYPGDVPKLDKEIGDGLAGYSFTEIQKEAGKTKRYDFGTTVKLRLADQFFYWFAMSDLNYNNNAKTTLKNVHLALEGLWEFIETKGEKQDIVIPLIGSGLGRLSIGRKKLIAIIAQSFLNASEENIFSNKLIIVIHPGDVDKANLNLFEVKDLLNHYLP
ncbi:macro domain-containing protein [Flavobacterium chungbukense]